MVFGPALGRHRKVLGVNTAWMSVQAPFRNSFQVRVSNPTNSDNTIADGCVVAVALFYSSVICPATFSVEEDDSKADDDSVDLLAASTQNVLYTDTPEMPLRSTPYIHRSHDQAVFCYNACVARPVDRKELAA